MRIVQTQNLAEELADAPSDVNLWVYNGFDVVTPHEILEAVRPRMTPNQLAFYDFERNLQGPAVSMMLNGCNVDPGYLQIVLTEHKAKWTELNRYVQQLAKAVWDEGLNVRSPLQMKEFFYGESGFNCKPKFTGTGTKRRVTCERKALEKVQQENYYTYPVIAAIFDLKDIGKAIEFLERGVESDGKVHASFNVAATESGRWSSSHNPWRRGGNFQNQSEWIRKIYLAEDGWVFAYPDLAQAEARGVAYESGDEAYIRAVNSGDVHTSVARLVYPELEWPDARSTEEGQRTIAALARELAETPFYRSFTYRDLAKRGAHGSNYGGQAFTLARHLNIPERQAEEFQRRYFEAFPGIREWHLEVQRRLQSGRILTTALGRERLFLGRVDSRETLKEALAWYPQSLISEIIKIGMLRVWRKYEKRTEPLVRMHADMHDGTLFSIKETHIDEIAPDIINLMTVPIQYPTGVLTIPVDFTVGYRWQKKEMLDWEPGVMGKLTRPEPTSLLDLEASLIEKT